jgi:hypothetical protein
MHLLKLFGVEISTVCEIVFGEICCKNKKINNLKHFNLVSFCLKMIEKNDFFMNSSENFNNENSLFF